MKINRLFSVHEIKLTVNYKIIRKLSSQEGKYININNANLYYERHGNSDQTLLLIPAAIGALNRDYKHQLKELSKHFTVISFDQRGYGKSIAEKRDFNSDFCHVDADDGAKIMKTLGYEKYSILGWCNGGVSAIIMAARFWQHIDKLVVWGSNTFVSDNDVAVIKSHMDIETWTPFMYNSFLSVYGTKEVLEKLWHDWINGYIRYNEQPDHSVCVKELNQIKCPTLIFHGNKDIFVPEYHADFMHERIKNSKLIKWENGKHDLHTKFYKDFNKIVTEFLLD